MEKGRFQTNHSQLLDLGLFDEEMTMVEANFSHVICLKQSTALNFAQLYDPFAHHMFSIAYKN